MYRDDGPISAKIVLIGEALGEAEDRTGSPFVGPAGWRLNEWLADAGLRRQDCYVTNVVLRRPIANKVETVPADELAAWTEALHGRIAALDDPWIVVPLGDVAVRALLGKGGSTESRGFIHAYQDRRGRTLKVIPSIHPARTFPGRMPWAERWARHDFAKIAAELAHGPRLDLPHVEVLTDPRISDLEAFLVDTARHDTPLAVDIETPGRRLVCVGFATSGSFAVVTPVTPETWPYVLGLCALSAPKVTQTGLYDAYWIAHAAALPYGVCPFANWRYDVHAMHHALDAADDHDLRYMASVELRMAPWKHIPKDPEARAALGEDRALLHYCGIDNCVQWTLADRFAARLHAAGRWSFYDQHYAQMFEPLLAAMRHGIAVDDGARRERETALRTELADVEAGVGREAAVASLTNPDAPPIDLFGVQTKKKREAGALRSLSSKKVQTYLYETLGLPRRINRDTGRATADEVAVRALMLKYPNRMERVGGLILQHRRTKKLLEFLGEARLDADGRMRSQYSFAPETGRLSSTKCPMGTGGNNQNVDRETRSMYVSDDGWIFMEVDLSQAEDRIVKVLAYNVAPTPTLLERARAMPWENDEHVRAAQVMFGLAPTAITESQRYIGKRGRHAGNYGLGGKGLSEQLLKDGYVYTPDECGGFIQRIIDKDTPEVREWQRWTRSEVMEHRLLTNDWGRELSFRWDRLDDDTYRRAYAFVPQSCPPAIINQYGWLPLWQQRGRWRVRVHVQGHDSLLMSVHPDDVWDVWSFLHTSLERPRYYGPKAVELVVPVELKLGRTWAMERKWKKPPTQEELRAAVEALQ